MTHLQVQNEQRADSDIEWRPIPGWPEYEVSEFGGLRRLMKGPGAKSARLLNPWRNKKTGYFEIALWRNNCGYRTTMHRIVALTFLSPPPSPQHLVAHNDGTRDNNHWRNLRWATQRENVADTIWHGTHNRGSRNGQAKLDEVCVAAIRKMAQMKIPHRIAADGFGICRQTVSDIVARKRWGHVR